MRFILPEYLYELCNFKVKLIMERKKNKKNEKKNPKCNTNI